MPAEESSKASTDVQIGNFVLSLKDQTLSDEKGNMAQLERPVFRLLVKLHQESPGVVHRPDLFEYIWPETVVSDDALYRCVSILRHLLRRPPGSGVRINTVRNRGYQLVFPKCTTLGTSNQNSVIEDDADSDGFVDSPTRRIIRLAIVSAGIAALMLIGMTLKLPTGFDPTEGAVTIRFQYLDSLTFPTHSEIDELDGDRAASLVQLLSATETDFSWTPE